MVKRLSKNHYLATPGETCSNSHGALGQHLLINPNYQHQDHHHHRVSNHRAYSTDGE